MDVCLVFFFFQAEDGIRDLVRSRGLGDVYKRQRLLRETGTGQAEGESRLVCPDRAQSPWSGLVSDRQPDRSGRGTCLLYTSDAADERSSVDLGGRRIIKKKKKK